MGHLRLTVCAIVIVLALLLPSMAAAQGYGVYDLEVTASADDGFAESTPTFDNSAITATFGNGNIAFIRFDNLEVPSGATVLSASVTFEAAAGLSGVMTTEVAFSDTDDASAPSSYADVNGMSKTTGVAYAQGNYYANQKKTISGLGSSIEEVFSRVGWASGNSLIFYIYGTSGTGYRTFRTQDSGDSTQPTLHLVFTGTADDHLFEVDSNLDDGQANATTLYQTAHYFALNSSTFYRAYAIVSDVAIAQGTVVADARLVYRSSSAYSAGVTHNSDISFENADEGSHPGNAAGLHALSTTTAVACTFDEDYGLEEIYETENLASSLNEIFARVGFVSGNDVMLIVDTTTSSNTRYADSWNEASTTALWLYVSTASAGYANDVIGVSGSDIGSIIGVDNADIGSVIGVE